MDKPQIEKKYDPVERNSQSEFNLQFESYGTEYDFPIKEFNEYLEKLFPIKTERDYCMEVLSKGIIICDNKFVEKNELITLGNKFTEKNELEKLAIMERENKSLKKRQYSKRK